MRDLAPNKRVQWLDALRGFAISFMVYIHFINVLSYKSIYTDPPYYFAPLDTFFPYLPIPSFLFAYISAMGVYISVRNRGWSLHTMAHLARRYGVYILLSLVFTSLVFGLDTFLNWDEAVQGIASTAIFFAFTLYLPDVAMVLLGLTFAIVNTDLWTTCDSLLCAPLYGGFFSVTNLYPLMVAGYLFFKRGWDGRLGVPVVLLSLGLHFFLGIPISYYQRTANFKLFTIGLCMIVAYLMQKKPLTLFQRLGYLSVIPYFLHFILLYKPIELSGVRFGDEMAVILALFFTFLTYLITLSALRLLNRVPKKKEII